LRPDRLAKLVLFLSILLVIVIPLLSGGLDLIVDWLWFRQEGFGIIYWTMLRAQIDLGSLVALAVLLLVGGNLLLARTLARRHGYRVHGELIEFPLFERFSATFERLIALGVVLVAWAAGEWAGGHAFDYLQATHAVALNQGDPLFGIDLSFYLFKLPFIGFLYDLALVIILVSFAGSAVLYALKGGVTITQRSVALLPAARSHLCVIGAFFFFALAYQARLSMYNLLYSERGLITGAGYTDIHALLPVLWILLVLTAAVGLALLASARMGRLRTAVYGVLVLAAVWIVGGAIYPEIVQRLIVAPSELDRERPYIARAIEFTRKAYALDRFDEHEFPAVEDLSANDLSQNSATIGNVRLWDHAPLLTTFSQLQEIRTYYDFARVDNDRYWINGSYRQVSLSPRELNAASLPSRNWINEHLTYTHGYGLCMGPVNEATPDGLPVFFVKDIPPASSVPSLQITRPEIYYGELPNDYCIVDTRLKEFDYPSGEENVYSTYAGSGGLPVQSFLRRLLFAVKFGELKVLLSTDVQDSSRVMIYRNVLERAGRLTPFLTYDHDPYLVVAADGSLVWMLDGYTTSGQYPYSEPFGDSGNNYIRNSVKATVDAYTGAVHFYVADATDPLIQVYSSLFPGVFQPLNAMPEDLRAHIRYPEDFFTIQASKYATYHMTDPRVFYNKEDLWRVAQSAARGDNTPMSPYYTIMKLAEVGTREEFILMVPFTPARKQNMIAWMAARCDAPNYGKVMVFTFPKQKLIYGPQQIESRIDQDPTISQMLTLWGQGGSRVIRGTLLVIPVRNSVLYIEPLYLSTETASGLPQLKRVIVSYSDKVVMDSTLDAALTSIFGGTSGTTLAAAPSASGAAGSAATPGPPGAGQTAGIPTDFGALAREAREHFEKADQLLRQGDWAGYGAEMKKLQDVLNRLAPR
jgi:uncharacterized membrane protein (UPF0182 family)